MTHLVGVSSLIGIEPIPVVVPFLLPDPHLDWQRPGASRGPSPAADLGDRLVWATRLNGPNW